jgi:hypothetical protein
MYKGYHGCPAQDLNPSELGGPEVCRGSSSNVRKARDAVLSAIWWVISHFAGSRGPAGPPPCAGTSNDFGIFGLVTPTKVRPAYSRGHPESMPARHNVGSLRW